MLRVPTMPMDVLPPRWAATGKGTDSAHEPRTSRTVLEDLFRTYTGCESLAWFLTLQREGAALGAALREGAGLPVAAIQPRVPHALQTWYEAAKARQPVTQTAAASTELAMPASAPPPSQPSGSVRRCVGCDAHSAKATGPSTRAAATVAGHSTVTAAADGGREPAGVADAADAADEEGVAAQLVPPLEELPPIVRCDAAAVAAVRSKVQFYFTRLYELVGRTNALAERWGRLTTGERSQLKEAIQAEKRARVGEQELLACFAELTFNEERLEALLPADMDACRGVRVLRCSDNPALTELSALPVACHSVFVCACNLVSIAAASPAVLVLGVSFNKLPSLSFIHQFPSLRVLDMTANAVTSVEETVAAINAHGHLQEVSLTGNPVALLDRYRSRIAAACPRLDRLDGQLILAEERSGATADSVRAVPAQPAAAPGAGQGLLRGGRRRQSAGGLHSSHNPSTRPGSKREAAAAPADAIAAADAAREAERPQALTVSAVAELLAVHGLSHLAHTQLSVSLTEDFKRNAEFLHKAMGRVVDTGSRPGSRVGQRTPAVHVAVPPPLDVAAQDAAGGRAGGTRHAASKASPLSSRKGISGTESRHRAQPPPPSSQQPSGQGRGRPSSRGPAPQGLALYHFASTLVLRGVWGAGDEEGADAVHIASAAIPLSSTPSVTPPNRGAAAVAAGGPSTAAVPALYRSVSLAGASAQLRRDGEAAAAAAAAAAAGGVVDGVYRPPVSTKEHRLFTAPSGGLAVVPDVAERLRRPFRLHVEVHDEVCFPDSASMRAALEGGAPAGTATISSAGTAAPPPSTAAANAGARPHPPHQPHSTAHSAAHSAAQKHLSAALWAAHPLEAQRQRSETIVFPLGTVAIDPAALVLRPPSAVPRSALAALAAPGDGAADPTEAAAAPDPTQCYQREVRLTGCRLERSAADRRAACLRLEGTREELRAAVAAYDAARAELEEASRRQEELISSAAAVATSAASPHRSPSSGSLSVAGGGSSTGHRSASFKAPASGSLQRLQAEAGARQATVAALALRVAVLARRIEELWGRADGAAPSELSVDLRLAIGRGPMTPAAAAAAAAQRGSPAVPTTRTRKAATMGGAVVR